MIDLYKKIKWGGSFYDLGDNLMEFDAFTGIKFNTKKSLNYQAEAVAIYVSLRKNIY